MNRFTELEHCGDQLKGILDELDMKTDHIEQLKAELEYCTDDLREVNREAHNMRDDYSEKLKAVKNLEAELNTLVTEEMDADMSEEEVLEAIRQNMDVTDDEAEELVKILGF
tara:strand:+ start:8102 stop:8437 length:336 start_codon:yes stop_codon:yes gene_type:complete